MFYYLLFFLGFGMAEVQKHRYSEIQSVEIHIKGVLIRECLANPKTLCTFAVDKRTL